MWPFVDPVTKKKVKFGTAGGRESILEGDLDAGQLLKECGGDLDVSLRRIMRLGIYLS